jgi:ABC-type protease/lipase transport system fused ATPase/permease subunit
VTGALTGVPWPTVLAAVMVPLASVLTAWLTRRGTKDVAELTAEQGAYTRASEIDAGVVARLEAENARLTQGWATDRARHATERAEWATERAELRAETERLEARLRELLDEVVALRSRHDIHDRREDSHD